MATAQTPAVRKKFSLGRRRTRREMALGLTPAAVFMLHYWIYPVLRNTTNGYARLNLAAFSRRKGSPCLRACREAYNRISKIQDKLGLSFVHNHDKVPLLYVCHTDWLDQAPDCDRLPLFYKENGKRRHLRARHEAPDLPDSANAETYFIYKNHDADSALTIYPSVLQKQTEKPFQSSPRKNSGFAERKLNPKLTGYVVTRCKEALPEHYGFVWDEKARGMVSGYVQRALRDAHDKWDIIEAFSESASALFRNKITSIPWDAGLVAVKATDALKNYDSRGKTREERLKTFAFVKRSEKILTWQVDADDLLRQLSSYHKTRLIDFTVVGFNFIKLLQVPEARIYLFGRTTRFERRLLYRIMTLLKRDLYHQERIRAQNLELMLAA